MKILFTGNDIQIINWVTENIKMFEIVGKYLDLFILKHTINYKKYLIL